MYLKWEEIYTKNTYIYRRFFGASKNQTIFFSFFVEKLETIIIFACPFVERTKGNAYKIERNTTIE